MTAIVSSLVGEWFAFDTEKCEVLEDQLLFFFNGSGAANEDVFSIITNPSAWPKPSKLGDEENSLALIMSSITLFLSQIALYTERALSYCLYLQKEIMYEVLVRWFGKKQSINLRDYKTTSISQVSQDLHKTTTFHVPKLQGDTLMGDDFIADVDCTFHSAAMA